MIGRSLGQTIEVLGQEWRFKGQAEEAALQSSTNPFLLTKRVGGKQGGVPCGDRFKLDLGDHSLNWQFGVMALQETMALVHHILQFLIAAFCLIFPGDPGATLRKGPQPNTQSLTHSLTHPATHSLTQSLTHPPTHSLTHSPHYLPHTHTLTHSRTRARTHSLTHPLTHSLTPLLLRGRRGTMCTAKGSDVRPGVPWVSASFAWQAWHNVHCQGVGCTPWRPLGLRLFCVAGVAQCALPRGRMYALASRWVSAFFAWQAWHNVHCQGVGCTPWRPLGLRLFCVAGVAQCALPRGRMYARASLGSPPLLRGRRGTMCTAKGSDVRPGVPWVSASFAWQAWHNVHCQGVGCTPWRPSGLRLFCVAGVAQCALPRGRMYALASPGSPPLLCGRRGTMCTAKGSDVRPGVPWVSAAFAWQAWHNVHVRPGVPWVSPPLSRGRRGTMCTAKGSDIRPGVPWVSASFAWQAWHNAAKGSDVRPGVPRVSASFAWQAWHNVHCQGVGCTPWRPLGLRLFCVAGVAQCALPRGRMYAPASLGSPPLLRGRRGTMSTALGLPHSSTHSRTHARSLAHTDHTHITHTHQPHITHSHSHSLTCTSTYIHTHPPHHHPSITPHHSPTITPPSLLSFLFPSCFSMLSLSLGKLVTCGVIRSYNWFLGKSTMFPISFPCQSWQQVTYTVTAQWPLTKKMARAHFPKASMDHTTPNSDKKYSERASLVASFVFGWLISNAKFLLINP